MVRRTIMQTEVIVEEQRLKPRRSQIRRRVRIEKAIARGINLGTVVLSTAIFTRVGFLVYEVINSRSGGLGGEILVFPALVLAFGFGYEFGARNERKQWEGDEDEESGTEHRTAGAGSR